MYIAVDLKVVEGLAASSARASGVSEDRILAGLVRLWHRCWVDGADVFTRPILAGLLGGTDLEPVLDALIAFGFLAPHDGDFRVCGATRYLRLKESRRAGGRAAAANLKTGAVLGSRAEQQTGSKNSALPPSTEHREKDVLPPKVRQPSRQEAWWAQAQALASERKPGRVADLRSAKDLNAMLKQPLDEIGGQGLMRAWGAYLASDHWAAKGWPLEGFASKWAELANRQPRNEPERSRVYG